VTSFYGHQASHIFPCIHFEHAAEWIFTWDPECATFLWEGKQKFLYLACVLVT
jgi:hypothetical protein